MTCFYREIYIVSVIIFVQKAKRTLIDYLVFRKKTKGTSQGICVLILNFYC